MIIGIPAIRVGEKYYVSPHFGRAPFFVIVEVLGNNYRVLKTIENPYLRREGGKGRMIVELLTSHNVKAVITAGIGYGVFGKLREHGIKIYYVPVEKGHLIELDKAIQMYLNKQLEEATKPRELE